MHAMQHSASFPFAKALPYSVALVHVQEALPYSVALVLRFWLDPVYLDAFRLDAVPLTGLSDAVCHEALTVCCLPGC